MYDDRILPIRNRVGLPSRSQTLIYFVRDQTNKSLFFIKWVELILCLLSLCFGILAINATDITSLNRGVIVMSSSSSTILVLVEITYPYLKRPLPLTLQVLDAGAGFAVCGIATIMVYQTNNTHELVKVLLFLNGLTAVAFLIDFICKLIISTYLYQTTRVKSVVDAAVSAFLPLPSHAPCRPKPPRSILTANPITYGGTFPVGKNEPPFLPEERSPPTEGGNTPDKGNRHRAVQTPQYGDCKAVGWSAFDDASLVDRLVTRSKVVQTYEGQENKGTSTMPPFYLEEERRKKSTWTCSTPTTSRKIDSRRQASMSTPITYSGTFAVNKDLVPITPGGLTGMSPKSSPRGNRTRSEGNSPNRFEKSFLNVGQLDQISEEKLSLQMSAENCSQSASICAFCDGSILPGSVSDDGHCVSNKRIHYELI